MAIQTINFTDKVALNEDPSVADINKCKASDLNEIKSVVNNNANEIPTDTSDLNNDSGFTTLAEANGYSTTETVIGKWTNNKPIYRKVVDFGELPATASAKYVNHNISNLGSIVKIDAIGYDGSSTHYPIPFVGNSYMYGNTSLTLRINATEIGIAATGNSFSGHTATVILEYTKSTD